MTAPPLVEPLSLARLAADLNLTFEKLSDEAKAELEFHLRAVIRHVEGQCGPIIPRSKVVALTLHRGRGLLPVWPVASVASAIDGQGLPVTLVVNEAGEASSTTHSSGTVEVTVTVGYAPETMPEDLALGILLIASHNYGVGQRVPGQGEGRPPGFGGGAASAPSPGYAIPNRAATFLAPYMLPGCR